MAMRRSGPHWARMPPVSDALAPRPAQSAPSLRENGRAEVHVKRSDGRIGVQCGSRWAPVSFPNCAGLDDDTDCKSGDCARAAWNATGSAMRISARRIGIAWVGSVALSVASVAAAQDTVRAPAPVFVGSEAEN